MILGIQSFPFSLTKSYAFNLVVKEATNHIYSEWMTK